MLNMIVYYWMAAVNKLFAIKSQKGATMIEYGLIAFLISVAALAVLGPIGDQLVSIFNEVLVALGGTAV